MELIKTEDILFDWKKVLYMNYTPVDIVDRISEFFATIGAVERIEGEVHVCQGNILNHHDL